ncbi:MAG: hypothetical protein IH586_07730 [Anaerolineaceae bacterium]|nr:hypothetical protein [Anaerolineaceae bacterium]
MEPSIYIALSIIVLGGVVLFFFIPARNRAAKRLTPLAGLAFCFILAGMFFGEERWLGYGLLGVGVVLALIDILRRSRGNLA